MKNKTTHTARNLSLIYLAVFVFVYGFSWHRMERPEVIAGQQIEARSVGAFICAAFWPLYLSVKWLEPEPPKPEPLSQHEQNQDTETEILKMDLRMHAQILHQNVMETKELEHQVNLLKLNQPAPTIVSNGPALRWENAVTISNVFPIGTNFNWTNYPPLWREFSRTNFPSSRWN